MYCACYLAMQRQQAQVVLYPIRKLNQVDQGKVCIYIYSTVVVICSARLNILVIKNFINIVCHNCAGVKRKVGKTDGDLIDVMKMLGELDREADERYEQREEKRMRRFLDAEEQRRQEAALAEDKRRQQERQHEENMQRMFLTFMQQTMSMCSGGSHRWNPPGPCPMPPPSYPPPYPQSPYDNPSREDLS